MQELFETLAARTKLLRDRFNTIDTAIVAAYASAANEPAYARSRVKEAISMVDLTSDELAEVSTLLRSAEMILSLAATRRSLNAQTR